MKYIISPDSFKGSLDAMEFCKIASEEILKKQNSSKIILMPLADGGEGTLDTMLYALNGKTLNTKVTGPFIDDTVKVDIGFFENGKLAVIETSKAMGLPLVGERKNPCLTTTFGVGQMIDYAILQGAEKIVLTLGGSSTNDCGTGMLCAMGAVFFDKNNKPFIPTGGTLSNVVKADFSELQKKIRGIQFTAMCDVKNPLCGKAGCAAVFAPQKGADKKMVLHLDSGAATLCKTLHLEKFMDIPGSGAAGGLGFATVALLNGKLKSGIETILDMYHFSKELLYCDYVLTGEGSFDEQSMMGKTIGGILERVKKIESKNRHFPKVAIFCGVSKIKNFSDISQIQSINVISQNQSLKYAMSHAKSNLRRSVSKWINSI
jgi:glycerate kinase